MNKTQKRTFRAAVIMLLALLIVITAGCSADENPQGSDIGISEIGGESSVNNSSAEESEESGGSESTSSEADSSSAEGEGSSSEGSEDFVIETPFVDLYYPGDWAPFLKVEQTEGSVYEVAFSAVLENGKSHGLFSVLFNVDDKEALGTITAEGGKVNVGVKSVDFSADESWTDNEVHIIFSMQEAVNHVLEKMQLEEVKTGNSSESTSESSSGTSSSGSGNSELPPEMAADMALDTPYGEIHYPSRWAEYLKIDAGEKNGAYSVAFYSTVDGNTPVHLFTIVYNSSEGAFLRTIKAPNGEMVEIRVNISELSFDSGWDEDQKNIAYAMQEDLNYLIEKLGL